MKGRSGTISETEVKATTISGTRCRHPSPVSEGASWRGASPVVIGAGSAWIGVPGPV